MLLFYEVSLLVITYLCLFVACIRPILEYASQVLSLFNIEFISLVKSVRRLLISS